METSKRADLRARFTLGILSRPPREIPIRPTALTACSLNRYRLFAQDSHSMVGFDSNQNANVDPAQLINRANAALSKASKGGFFSWGNKEEKYIEAASLYKDAATNFRKDPWRNTPASGAAAERAAELYSQTEESLETPRLYQDAFKMYKEDAETKKAGYDEQVQAKRDNPAQQVDESLYEAVQKSKDNAVRCAKKQLELTTGTGNFRRGAELAFDLGQFQENMGMLKEALVTYQDSIKWSNDEGVHGSANKSRQRAGAVAAQLQDYYLGARIFWEGAQACLKVEILKFSTKVFLFKAGICQLAIGDEMGIKRAFDSYDRLDRKFSDEREAQFIHAVFDAMVAKDGAQIAHLSSQWDKMTRFDEWMVTALLAAKAHAEKGTGADIAEADDEFA